jgi:hypothetical protein
LTSLAGLQKLLSETKTGAQMAVSLGFYPIVTFQYSSTTLYQVSYHIRYLFFESDHRVLPQVSSKKMAAVVAMQGQQIREAQAGFDEGLLSLPLPDLLCTENPCSYRKFT